MAKPDGQEENRLKLYGQTLPELPVEERLADVWTDLGYSGVNFSGPAPFEWTELQAYAALLGIELSPVEARCLIDMSRSYCAEAADTSPLRIAPMERDL